MGAKGAYGVQVANSYARRSGDEVTLRLHLPSVDHLAQPTLQLKRIGKGQARVVDTEVSSMSPAATGVMLTAVVPTSAVSPGRWQLRLRDGEEDPFRRVQARLVVNPHQPVALLVGRAPDTLMAPPRPRKQAGPAPVARGAGRASAYLTRLRRAARRLKPAR